MEQIELHKEKVVQAEQEAETEKLIQEQKKKDARLRLLEIIDDYKTKKRKWTSCYREVLSLGLWDEPNWQEAYKHHKSQMENVFNEYIFEKQGEKLLRRSQEIVEKKKKAGRNRKEAKYGSYKCTKLSFEV